MARVFIRQRVPPRRASFYGWCLSHSRFAAITSGAYLGLIFGQAGCFRRDRLRANARRNVLSSKIQAGGIRPANQFLAFLCLWLLSTPVLAFTIIPLLYNSKLKILVRCLSMFTAEDFLRLVFGVFALIFGFLIDFIEHIIASMPSKGDDITAWTEQPETGLVIAHCSAGQVIPVVVGLGTLMSICWKLIKKPKVGKDKRDQIELLPIAFQHPDDTWR
ncbi:hypothetical protein BDZ45DRAFT_781609 [Acephala macrosclerotiorum]|nr:hypothetical protein BDZ45DRAFT_781609 [Acephala macrosclerotiorum]